MKYVILAGGGGTRLWPLSRSARPKQFQPIVGGSTLLELTRRRLGNAVSDNDIYYSTNAHGAAFVRRIMPKVSEDHLIIEPERRDTGPAMGFAAAVLELISPDEPLAFLPSDHYIKNLDAFQKSFKVAEELIQETGSMLDIGVVPNWPNPNLGYTKIGTEQESRNGVSVFTFRGHTEKPLTEKAKELLASGEYLWHANYYMWTPRNFLGAYQEYAPKTYASLRKIQEYWQRRDQKSIAREYSTIEKISIDYAITEKLDPQRVLIIRAPFDWSDVGSFRELKNFRSSQPDDVVVEGVAHIGEETSNCFIYGPKKKLIVTIGIKNLVVVDTEDALLICQQDKDQEIKRINEILRERGLDHYL